MVLDKLIRENSDNNNKMRGRQESYEDQKSYIILRKHVIQSRQKIIFDATKTFAKKHHVVKYIITDITDITEIEENVIFD